MRCSIWQKPKYAKEEVISAKAKINEGKKKFLGICDEDFGYGYSVAGIIVPMARRG